MADDDVARLWDLVDKTGFGPFTTHGGEDIRSRPVAAVPHRDRQVIAFLSGVASWTARMILPFARPDGCAGRMPSTGIAWAPW